jgi:alcohol dehydrogenase (NADP+)
MTLYHTHTQSVMSTTQFSSELRGQYKAKAYAAASAKSPLAPAMIPRRDPGEDDVQIEILFCGICHSDLHTVRSEWSAVPTVYPCVPGHEIVGRVTKVGSAVTKFKPGDLAARLSSAPELQHTHP